MDNIRQSQNPETIENLPTGRQALQNQKIIVPKNML